MRGYNIRRSYSKRLGFSHLKDNMLCHVLSHKKEVSPFAIKIGPIIYPSLVCNRTWSPMLALVWKRRSQLKTYASSLLSYIRALPVMTPKTPKKFVTSVQH